MSTLLYETEKNEPGKIMMPLRERKPEGGVVLGALDLKQIIFPIYSIGHLFTIFQINLVSAVLRQTGTWVEMVSKQVKMIDEKLKERIGMVCNTETRAEDLRKKGQKTDLDRKLTI